MNNKDVGYDDDLDLMNPDDPENLPIPERLSTVEDQPANEERAIDTDDPFTGDSK